MNSFLVLLLLSFFLLADAASKKRNHGKKSNNQKGKGKGKIKDKENGKAEPASRFCTSHFELMERFPPYTKIQPGDPNKLLEHEVLYFRSLNKLNMSNILDYAENSAYIRDFIMPRLRKLVNTTNPEAKITREMDVLARFIGKTQLCHEFWKFQVDLFSKDKADIAHHLFDEYERITRKLQPSEYVDDDPHVQDAIETCLEHVRKVYEEEKGTYETPEFIEKFEKDFPQQDTIEEALDFCSQQLITMQSALQRHLELISDFDEKQKWSSILEHCSIISSENYVTNLWMRKLVEIRTEKNENRRNLLLGKFVSVLEHKLAKSCPRLSTFEGVERFSDRWMIVCLSITKAMADFNSTTFPDLKFFFDDTLIMYSLAEMRIIRSLWKHLSYPYDKENYFKVVYDYEGYEPVNRADIMGKWLDKKATNYILENLASGFRLETLLLAAAGTGNASELLSSKLTVQSYQKLIHNLMRLWPQEAENELCSTLEKCRPLSNEEWDILVTPMKKMELLPPGSGIVDLSPSENLIVRHEIEKAAEENNPLPTVIDCSSLSVTKNKTSESECADCKQEKNKLCTGHQPIAAFSRTETVQEENERLMKERQATINHYNRLRKEKGWELVRKRKEARLLSGKASCTSTAAPTILFANLGDFLALFPEAARVHEMNRKDRTVVKALNRRSKKQRFRWALDPSVVIDFETYKFLAAVFVPACSARKTLNFTEFEDCVRALGGTVSGTVYSFPRRLEVDGKIYITPPGEVHSEHKSSDVNHKSMSIFLGYAGLHVDLFEPIK